MCNGVHKGWGCEDDKKISKWGILGRIERRGSKRRKMRNTRRARTGIYRGIRKQRKLENQQ